jgi:hypothetical protein
MGGFNMQAVMGEAVSAGTAVANRTTFTALEKTIKVLLAKAAQTAEKSEQFSISAGLQLKELKELHQEAKKAKQKGWRPWDEYVRATFDMGQQWADEDLTRLSRNDADTARFKEIITFNKIEILTQTGWKKGSDFAVHGLINSFDKGTRAVGVRRGQSLSLSLGQVPGAPAYGYRVVKGQPGEHEIDPEAAKIVVRIFSEYAVGRSPSKIAADLTREGIPTPASHRDSRYKGSTTWNNQTFVGGMYAKGIRQPNSTGRLKARKSSVRH